MRYIKGDILDTNFPIIHGVNTLGVMGAGVAKSLAKKFPQMYQEYKEFLQAEPNSNFALGAYCNWWNPDPNAKIPEVFSAFIQNKIGRTGKQADYTALVFAIDKIATDHPHNEIYAIPLIGCGLGGLWWPIVCELLMELEHKHSIEFVVYYLNDEDLEQ